jgi:hypothetical protein
MATAHYNITINGAGQNFGPAQRNNRRRVYIRNYSSSTGTMWLRWDGTAAASGGNGEMEIIPGGEYQWGGPIPARVKNLPLGQDLPHCPQEQASIASSGGAANGCIVIET